jgi:hypothetical protein
MRNRRARAFAVGLVKTSGRLMDFAEERGLLD